MGEDALLGTRGAAELIDALNIAEPVSNVLAVDGIGRRSKLELDGSPMIENQSFLKVRLNRSIDPPDERVRSKNGD